MHAREGVLMSRDEFMARLCDPKLPEIIATRIRSKPLPDRAVDKVRMVIDELFAVLDEKTPPA
jgi:hypothetical protein